MKFLINELMILIALVFSSAIGHAQTFENYQRALLTPEKVTDLSVQDLDPQTKHLPKGLGTLVNLRELKMSCLENLEELPAEIGSLTKLEKLIIDNGNGCSMNVLIPAALGNLQNLRVLRLYGALDSREVGPTRTISKPRSGGLPVTIGNLKKLEELDLGRNGIDRIPPQVGELSNLRKLTLDYNEIHELPTFIGQLKKLQELSLSGMGGVTLPNSLSNLAGLKISLGNNFLKRKDQEELRRRFPRINFDFSNEFDDAAANEEGPN